MRLRLHRRIAQTQRNDEIDSLGILANTFRYGEQSGAPR